MLDCQLYGLNAGGHHLTNVLLHAATAILLFLVLRQMTGRLWPSALVAALFAVHPLRVESVAWVTERKDVLSGLFFVLDAGGLRRLRASSVFVVRYLAVMVFFALGLMAKPMLVTLPLVLLLLDYWPLGRMTRSAATKDIPVAGGRAVGAVFPFLASGDRKAPALVAGGRFLRGDPWTRRSLGAQRAVSLAWRMANALVSYVAYLGQFFWPVGLAVLYPHPGVGLPLWKVIGAVAVLACISAGALACWRRYPYLLVGWLWYLGMLVPVIGLVQVGVAGDGRPLHVLAADRPVHCLGLGRGGRVPVLAVSSLAVRRRVGAGAGGPDGLCVASDLLLARQRDPLDPYAGLHFAEQCGPRQPWQRPGWPRTG